MADEGETGPGPESRAVLKLVRFADGGDPVTVESAGQENVWAIGRPDERRMPVQAMNLRTGSEMKPGTVFTLPDGRVMRVTEPSRAAAAAGGPKEVGVSVYVSPVLRDEVESMRSPIPSWQELQEQGNK